MNFRSFFFFVSLTFFASCTLMQEVDAATWNLPTPKTPEMRVLLAAIEGVQEFTGEGRFIVHTESKDVWCEEEKESTVSIAYDDGAYTVTCTSGMFITQEPVQVTAKKLRKRVQALTYSNRPLWNPTLNDNVFYGSLEVVYSMQSHALLLVNEIPIEKYVRGIAEASNENDSDYLEALMMSARTYAWYNMQNPTKHAGEPYILDATAGDQVYRGASFSDRAPNIVAAQIATKRQTITYKGETIVAPFFSHSDGRTRSWAEVWNGDYAWSQSVADPCCTEYTELSGHGVGLSAEGARYFAEQEGWKAETILKYYYTGVEIEQGY
ncbi:MAG: hypothetical protein KIH62_001990 [Candidatus Kerfeldbacteria bacterium]|nr:hypothetical protein [Candidatus Kerfeldbacteria bacterium]